MAFGGVCVGGCSSPTTPSKTPPTTDAVALVRALASLDRVAFLAHFADEGPAQALGTRLWGAWRALSIDRVASAPGTLTVVWRAPGERTASNQPLAATTDESGRITALTTNGAAPVWLVEDTHLLTAGASNVLAGTALSDAVAGRWLAAASSAASRVSQAGLGSAASGWEGTLVVEAPSTLDLFRRCAGLDGGAALSTSAVTKLADAGSSARIVVNPLAAASLDDAAMRTLLVHEGVHAATRSAVSSAPLWAVEGLAESVAEASDAATARRNADLVRAARPTALPSVADLNGADALTAYALAAAAVRAAEGRWGRPSVMKWMANWSAVGRPSDADLTACFLAAVS